jgi:hypothetical protein
MYPQYIAEQGQEGPELVCGGWWAGVFNAAPTAPNQHTPELVVQVVAALGADVDVVRVKHAAPEEAEQPALLPQRQVVPVCEGGEALRKRGEEAERQAQ